MAAPSTQPPANLLFLRLHGDCNTKFFYTKQLALQPSHFLPSLQQQPGAPPAARLQIHPSYCPPQIELELTHT
jgi:hypothetical protein